MVVSAGPSPTVVWHDLECGFYDADLPLWRELASAATPDGTGVSRVLDVGSGTGRVALDLARAGHSVTALDVDAALLEALTARAVGLPITPVLADARDFDLEEHEFDLCVVPMQTLQLVHGASERAALFARVRAHLRRGALLACAIVAEVDEFDSREGGLGPSPERVEIDGTLYMSRAVRVAREAGCFAIERERLVVTPADEPSEPIEQNRIELEVLDEPVLQSELRAAGFSPEPTRTVAETDEHSGSEVVIGRA